MDIFGYMFFFLDSEFVDEVEVIIFISIDYRYFFCVICVSDEEILLCGNINIMKFYNF